MFPFITYFIAWLINKLIIIQVNMKYREVIGHVCILIT